MGTIPAPERTAALEALAARLPAFDVVVPKFELAAEAPDSDLVDATSTTLGINEGAAFWLCVLVSWFLREGLRRDASEDGIADAFAGLGAGPASGRSLAKWLLSHRRLGENLRLRLARLAQERVGPPNLVATSFSVLLRAVYATAPAADFRPPLENGGQEPPAPLGRPREWLPVVQFALTLEESDTQPDRVVSCQMTRSQFERLAAEVERVKASLDATMDDARAGRTTLG
jgi:hypothetical protein